LIKIWIRKPVSTRAKIIAGASGLVLVLIAWLITTTIRLPESNIPVTHFEKLVLPSLDTDGDRVMLGSLYSRSGETYRLKKKKTPRQYLIAWTMLVRTGYSAEDLPAGISAEQYAKMSTRLEESPLFPGEYQFTLEDLESLYTPRDDRYSLVKETGLDGDMALARKMAAWQLLASAGIPPRSGLPNPIISANVLSHPLDIIKSYPGLILDTNKKNPRKFVWRRSLLFAIWVSLRRELIAFLAVLLFALPIGVMMSSNYHIRAFYMPFLVIGTFIPIAALIPLTIVFLGVNEIQKVTFLALGMFFVLLGLVMKEMDEVDGIYLETSYTLGFSQLQTMALVNLPIALPRIWKHFAAIFGLGWGYIIFAEMINVGDGDAVNGIGWLFIIRRRRLQIADMYAIFFVIIFFAFLFSYLFKGLAWLFFKHERSKR
jgi:NitT/TauT family transport system permease protein